MPEFWIAWEYFLLCELTVSSCDGGLGDLNETSFGIDLPEGIELSESTLAKFLREVMSLSLALATYEGTTPWPGTILGRCLASSSSFFFFLSLFFSKFYRTISAFLFLSYSASSSFFYYSSFSLLTSSSWSLRNLYSSLSCLSYSWAFSSCFFFYF